MRGEVHFVGGEVGGGDDFPGDVDAGVILGETAGEVVADEVDLVLLLFQKGCSHF